LVSLEKILPNWVGERANTYPGQGDNDVCHGPTRQFFTPQLSNGGKDRSTEPVVILLKDSYCMLDEAREPSFGDYLYTSGKHSGRYVMTDPKSGRGISFSVQSGGIAAYHFWWLDEDFSGKPFERRPMKNWRSEMVDVFRRCR
jgi:hypothetical protein